MSDDSDSPLYISQLHFVPSPTSDTHHPHHRLRGYRSDSTESTVQLGSGEISRLTRDMTLVTESSQMSFDLTTELSHKGTTVSSPTCVGDQEATVLSPYDIYPVAPENFSRHEKRRKM